MPRPLTSAVGTAVLSRNKACSRCKQRKMKCDGKLPCAPCVYALGKRRGPTPECKYDTPYPSTSGRPSYAELEERIKQLELQVHEETLAVKPQIDDTRSLDSVVLQSISSKLPPPMIVRNLTDIFFRVTLFADKFIHRPSLMAALSLPENHPDFPHPAILHEICALGALFTDSLKKAVPSVFSERQEQFAKEARDDILARGDKEEMIVCLQSSVAHTWFRYLTGTVPEWRNLQIDALRFAVSLGLANGPGHRPLRLIPDCIPLPEPRSPIEAETRVNIFWVIYWCERWQRAYLSVPSSAVDDRDVTQHLPVTASDFESGVASVSGRQGMHSPQWLETHDTDMFTLQVKGSILISKIATFVHRQLTGGLDDSEQITAQLEELDEMIVAFSRNIRRQRRKSPIDSEFLVITLVPHVATILLYEHADVADATSHRSVRLLGAAQAIAVLAYIPNADYYEATTLDNMTASYWYLACRIFTRFISAHLKAGNIKEAVSLKRKVEYLKYSLTSLGNQMQLFPWSGIVNGWVERNIGERYESLGKENIA